VKAAAAHAKVKRQSHYDWLASVEYREAFTLAGRMAADALLDEAKRRAQFGTREYVLYQGNVVTVEKVEKDGTKKQVPLVKVKYSDAMTMFLIERLTPGMHEKREILHTEEPPQTYRPFEDEALDLTKLSEEELTALERIAGKITAGSGSAGTGPA
jgi:hypothetical protein